MHHRSLVGLIAFTSVLLTTVAHAQIFDMSKYPDLRGQWTRARLAGVIGQPSYDPTKSEGKAQQAPLTPEYQAIHEASIADQKDGGQGSDPTYLCLPPGMPRLMNLYDPMEIVVTLETTYLLIEYIRDSRRIYTDGRDWPKDFDPTFAGYSIGQWLDEDGDGRYDVLAVETRFLKGPRALDATGLPLHSDNKTIVKERIFPDKADRNKLYDEITTIDNAFTRPWTITKTYVRAPTQRPIWREAVCAENNVHVVIGGHNYMLSADGLLMPARKDQPPPDLRYFKQAPK
jgi:hypothetical protein